MDTRRAKIMTIFKGTMNALREKKEKTGYEKCH